MAASVANLAPAGRRGRRRRTVMSEINVTPFVDVMLVLLIVFMVTAPLMTLSINVDLPHAHGGTALKSDQAPLIVQIKKSGNGTCSSQADLFLDKTPIAIEQIAAKFEAIKNSNTSIGQQAPTVWVNADKDVCYEEVMRILGRITDAGLRAALNKLPPQAGD